jgi:hypothetical protein
MSSPSGPLAVTSVSLSADSSKSLGSLVWISAKKRVSFYAEAALRCMVQYEQVELHGLGAGM